MKERATDVAGDRGELEWSRAYAFERPIDLVEKSCGESGSFVFVPLRRVLEVGLCEWPEQ